MAVSTTTTLGAVIPDEVIVAEMGAVHADRANLMSLCNVQRGALNFTYNHLDALSASAVVEGAVLGAGAQTIFPIGTTITAAPQECDPVQITNLALRNQQVDFLGLGGNLGVALAERSNALVTATFNTAFDGNIDVVNSTDGAGALQAFDMEAMDLAIQMAEGSSHAGAAYPGTVAMVLHPAQAAAIRSDIRTSGDYISREDILAVNPALDARGLLFGYYGVPVYVSARVFSGAETAAAGAGVELFTGITTAGGFLSAKQGAIFTVGNAIGYNEEQGPNIRSEATSLIGTGGLDLVAGMVAQAARVNPYLAILQSA